MLRFFLISIFLITGAIAIKSCSSDTHKDKVYLIGRDENWYSMRFMGKEKNILAFVDDLMISFSASKGYKVQFARVSGIDLIPNLESGKFDLIVSALAPTPLNSHKYAFSESFFLVGPVLVVPKDLQISSLEDMDNKIVGIQSGASVVFNIEKYPDIVFRSYENIRQALDDVVNGKIDGAIMGAIPAYVYVQNVYGSLKIATAPLNNDGLKLLSLIRGDGSKFIKDFDEYIKKAKASGSYDSLLKKWGLFNPEEISPSGT
jgi:polar amino acid transport system substrate-binding protein